MRSQPLSLPGLPAAASSPASANPLVLWHLLSLDAPTVAVLWLWFAARATHTPLAPAFAGAMFLAVWILYIADRLLDARTTPAQPTAQLLAERHRFHQRHRTAFLFVLAAAAFALVLLLPHAHLPYAYFTLVAIMLTWFAVVHLFGQAARVPKEIVTGAIFAAAIWLPELPHHWRPAFLFAALCALNCVSIHTWEGPQQTHALTRILSHRLPWLLAALTLTLLSGSPPAVAMGLAAAGLFLLNLLHHRLPPTLLRALADAVLLTPLLYLGARL